MKTLVNKETTLLKADESGTTYAELAEVCLNRIPEGGLNVSEMRDRVNVLGKLKSANGKIKLEDAEAAILKACVTSMPWAIIHTDVVQFSDAVEKL